MRRVSYGVCRMGTAESIDAAVADHTRDGKMLIRLLNENRREYHYPPVDDVIVTLVNEMGQPPGSAGIFLSCLTADQFMFTMELRPRLPPSSRRSLLKRINSRG